MEKQKPKKIYLACSFAFQDVKLREKRQHIIEKYTRHLRSRGFNVFVPHEHKIDPDNEMPNYLWSKTVQQMDVKNLCNSDYVVLLTFGKTGNNGGVCWEAGYAYGIGKPLIIVKENKKVESFMMMFSCYAIVDGYQELRKYDFTGQTEAEKEAFLQNIKMS